MLSFVSIPFLKNNDGRITLTPEETSNEITIDRDIIVLSTPEVARLAPWVIALVAAGGLAAASFFPAIFLGIFDERTNKEGAIAGMVTGLVFTAGYIIGVKFYGMSPWLFGISPEGIGTVGMIINLVVTLVVSRLTPAPPLEVQEMVARLRSPEGNDESLGNLGEEQLSQCRLIVR